MFHTEDETIRVSVAKEISELVFQPSDWSVVNIPTNKTRASALSANLYNMPTNRHVSLVLNRKRRADRVKGLSNLGYFDDKRWKFLDNVNISYEKPSNCSNNGFLPLSEQGFLFYKGDSPDTKGTDWASGNEYKNATNEWVLMHMQVEKKFFKQTYYQKFSWGMQLILMTLCGHLENGRFIYGLPVTPIECRSLRLFCKKFNLKVELMASSEEEAQKIIYNAENIEKSLIDEVCK